METASKDVLFTIALNLELPSLLKWCSSNSRINRDVCQNDNVWRSKLLKDFSDDYPDFQKYKLNKSLRETYVFLYQLSYIKKLLKKNESLYDIFLKKLLILSAKGLEKVPAFDLPNLQQLNLENNQLTQVPAFHLPNLQYLDLSGNQLTQVPGFDLANLQGLYLNSNQLTHVPAFNLPNLQYLYLYNNQLKEVPIFDFPKLEILYLDNNQLTEMPVFDFPNLRKLDLSNNRLTEASKKEIKRIYGKKVKV